MSKPYTSYNLYFFIPFLLWVITGGIILLSADGESIFRFINGHHTTLLDSTMYAATMLGEGAVISLVLLILLGNKPLRNWWYFTAAVLCNVIPSLITQYIKHSVRAPRPLKLFGEAGWVHTLPDWPKLMENSFPSGHTCGAFGFFAFLAILLPSRYRIWGGVFFLLALLVAYSRIYLAVHFFADVYVGSLIGATFTLFVIAVMNRYSHLFFKKVS